MTGFTTSVDFPRAGAFQPTHAGSDDVFVTKLDPTGSALVYSTYLGGSGSDAGSDIAVDAAGNAYVTGATQSPDFPTAGALQTYGGETDVFVTKLGSTGSTLVYSTFLGGSDVDSSLGIALDATGSAYVAGSTLSPDFPTTAGAYQTTPASGLPAPPIFAPHRYDAFVTKLAPTGSLAYSTYLGGGSNAEVGADVAVDTAGNAYVTGTTRSVDYPTTPGAFQTVNDASSEAAYVTKLNATGSSLVYSTYLSGSHHEFGAGIAVDAAGYAYVSGGTQSVDFPITANAAQPVLGGDADAFITKFDPTGTAVTYSTYLGSSGQEWADDIAIDPGGHAYVTGTTRSTDFPTTAGVFQPAFGGGFYDSFVAKVDPVGGGTVYSSYLGGSDAEFTLAIAVDAAGSAYVTGATVSVDFPTTAGSFQPTYGEARDGFVTKIGEPVPTTVGKVTGGGSVALGNDLGTFALAVQRTGAGEPITGNLQYVNHATKARVRAVTFTAFSIAGDTATVEGTCTIDGLRCTFLVTANDSGSPGDDAFVIRVSAAAPEGGVLRGGNIRIHP